MAGSGGVSRSDPDTSRAVRRRALVTVTLLLAVAAAVVVVVSDDARWLRLAVVAGLWATLLVTVLGGRRGTGEASDALQRAYEEELAGEVEARREREAALEEQVRRELAAERSAERSADQEEIAALRGEVERLRQDVRVRDARAGEAEGHRVPQPHLRVVGGTPYVPPPAPPPAARPTPGPAPMRSGVASVRPLRPAGPPDPRAVPSGPHTVPPPAAVDPGARRAGQVDHRGVALNGSAMARGRSAAPDARAPEWSDPTGSSFVDGPGRAVDHGPGASVAGSSGTGSRTVAELIAAHAAERERRSHHR